MILFVKKLLNYIPILSISFKSIALFAIHKVLGLGLSFIKFLIIVLTKSQIKEYAFGIRELGVIPEPTIT